MVDSPKNKYAPNGICFWCGPKNRYGLKLKSVPRDEAAVADWKPKPRHVAFGNFGNGGIISVLMDRHVNWAAAYTLMTSRRLSSPLAQCLPNIPSSSCVPPRLTRRGSFVPGRLGRKGTA